MKKILKIMKTVFAGIVLTGLCGHENAEAQTISPVISQTVLQAPYMYRIQDWSNMPAERLHVRIKMLDTRVGQASLYLKMEMESNRLKIENPYPLPVGITLAGGGEAVLDAVQLGIYFSASNLHISGNALSQLQASNGILPDGLYTLRFKVFEAESGRQVSTQETPAMFNLLSGEPPLVSFPAENATLPYSDPCHIRFQWQPRHLQFAAGFQTEYTFEIAEIPQGVSTWQEYFHTLPQVYQYVTTNTFFDYGPDMPLLIPEKEYAIRVRAVCNNAAGEQLNIKNDGYSRVQKFFYHESCPTVVGLRQNDVHASTAVVGWSEPLEARSYQVFYRKNGKPDAHWFKEEEIPAGTSEIQIKNLTPATGYECKISVHCAYTQSENDPVLRFTTLSNDNAQLECGKHSITSDSSRSNTPLASLRPFDQIRTSTGFLIDVEEAEGSDGTFSGRGNTHIPLLANTGVKVKFKNVFINSNYELVSGVIEAEKSLNDM